MFLFLTDHESYYWDSILQAPMCILLSPVFDADNWIIISVITILWKTIWFPRHSCRCNSTFSCCKGNRTCSYRYGILKNVKYLSHFRSFKIEVYVLEEHWSSLMPSFPAGSAQAEGLLWYLAVTGHCLTMQWMCGCPHYGNSLSCLCSLLALLKGLSCHGVCWKTELSKWGE